MVPSPEINLSSIESSMCGIYGYIGKSEAPDKIHNGLKRLEYRGYDSWGIAILAGDKIQFQKETGAISDLDTTKLKTNSAIGIGHTRWATHGGVTERNTHPHISTDGRFTLAQNGIVENFQEHKSSLESEYPFYSETDTEVIVRLIEQKLDRQFDNNDLVTAIREAFLELEGRNSIIILDSKSNQIVAIRNGSPLVVGICENEYFIASDTLSFADQTNKIMELDNFDMVIISADSLQKINSKNGEDLPIEISEIDVDESNIDKEGYPHFMIKEIIEQKNTIRSATQYSEQELQPLVKAIKESDRVYTVGAGTASYAAAHLAWMLREYPNIQAEALKAYEVGSYIGQFSSNDLVIAVSQSGETADTIEALEIAQKEGVKIASIVNMVSSTITRMSDISYLTRSGPEICVASTKAFTAQLSWGLLVAMTCAGKYSDAQDLIAKTSKYLDEYLDDSLLTMIDKLTEVLADQEHFFVLGREKNFYTALEAALKIKEITYKHFEGFTAGELKHGVIALIEEGTPVFAIISDDKYKNDMISAVAEVKSRGAFVVAVADQDNDLFDLHIPSQNMYEADPIVKVIPFQLISYYLGVRLGCDPDKPRNLAKSVTVK